MALGSYPATSLKAARTARDDAGKSRQGGLNPVQKRKAERLAASASSANTFDAVAAEFHGQQKAGWSSSYAEKWRRLVEKDPARVKVVVASLMQPAAAYPLPSSGPRRPSRVRG